MIFQPVVIGAGLGGWQFLQATYDAQFKAFGNDPQLARDSDHFAEKIGNVFTAQELVGDRRLLSVALGAFGLSDDIDNRFFIQKILEDGTSDPDSLANRLADDRYRQLSQAFGFGPGEIPGTLSPTRMDEILGLFKSQSFEVAVGQQDDSMRIALFAQRELDRLANNTMSEDAKWFSVMALPPLRTMFESALNLPSSFAGIDIDKQLQVFKDRTFAAFGSDTISQFDNPEMVEKVTTLYLARSQIAAFNASVSSGSTALTLLRSSGF